MSSTHIRHCQMTVVHRVRFSFACNFFNCSAGIHLRKWEQWGARSVITARQSTPHTHDCAANPPPAPPPVNKASAIGYTAGHKYVADANFFNVIVSSSNPNIMLCLRCDRFQRCPRLYFPDFAVFLKSVRRSLAGHSVNICCFHVRRRVLCFFNRLAHRG
jgi:hypothetical protein